jgi:AcrR family transcriptional regulator
MRRKDQGRRREQLRSAARAVMLERGAVGMRIKDIAERAGLSSSLVLYYYPELDQLLLDVTREAMGRYAERRAEGVGAVEDPRDQLRLAISLGVPTGPEDDDSRLLYELDALTGSSPLFATLSANFFDRQVMLYERIVERGVDAGVFSASADPQTIARGLVALEDGLGLQVVLGHPGIDGPVAEGILLDWAAAAVGTEVARAAP